jgi:hypothetical protein
MRSNSRWVRPLRTVALLTILAIGIAFSGCTVKLIGDYDDAVDRGITDVQQKAELYFAKLQSNSDTPYDQSFHDDITARLTVLKSRAASLEQYSIISQQVTALQKIFADFERADKITPRPLKNDDKTQKPPLVANTEPAVTVAVENILKLELKLKRGATPSTASTSASTPPK